MHWSPKFERWFMVSWWKDSAQIRIKQLWCCKESESNPPDFIMLILVKNNSSIWLQCKNKQEITKLVSSHYIPPFKTLLSLFFARVFTCIQLSLFKCLKHKFPTEGITLLLPAVPWVIPHSNKATLPGHNNLSQTNSQSAEVGLIRSAVIMELTSSLGKTHLKKSLGLPPQIDAFVQSWNRDWTLVERRGWQVISAL